jgi:thioredoxin-like negative regulator of GroEL
MRITPLCPSLLVGVLALVASPPAADGGSATALGPEWHSSIQSARAAAKQHGKLVFVDLYADWCGWCKELEKKVFSTPEFKQWAAREVVLLRVDTEDGGDGTMLYQRFGQGSLPTTLVLTPDFGVVARIQGFSPAPKFLAKLETDVSSWRELDKRFDALANSTDTEQLHQVAEALHGREDGHRAAILYRRLIEVSKPNPIKRADLLTRTADAHRLAAEYDQALAALDLAAPHLQAAGEALSARAELLRSEIAHERGDCSQAKSSLEQFLATRPRSSLARSAQRLLDYIESGHSPACA